MDPAVAELVTEQITEQIMTSGTTCYLEFDFYPGLSSC